MANDASILPMTSPKNIRKLFHTAGFHDRNHNETIDSRSIGNLWLAKEGYTKNADLNGDGTIVIAEAKYYLRNMGGAGVADMRRFALTDLDKASLLGIFKERLEDASKIKGKAEKSSAIESIVEDMAKADLFKEAASTAESIEVAEDRFSAYQAIVRMLPSRRYQGVDESATLNKALEILRALPADSEKISFYSELLTTLDVCDYDDKAIRDLTVEAIGTINENTELIIGSLDLKEMVVLLCGRMMFKEALMAARVINAKNDPIERAESLVHIARYVTHYQKGASINAHSLFVEACELSANNNSVYLSVIRTMAFCGFKNEALERFQSLIAKADGIKETEEKLEYLSDVATAMAKGGLKSESRELFLQIADTARRDAWFFKSLAVTNIAGKMIEAGLYREALELSCSIKSTSLRYVVIAGVASFAAKSGMGENELFGIVKECVQALYTGGKSKLRNMTLGLISSELIKAKRYLLAYKLLEQKMEKGWFKDSTLQELCKALTVDGKYDEAIKIAKKIVWSKYLREETTKYVIEQAADKRQFSDAMGMLAGLDKKVYDESYANDIRGYIVKELDAEGYSKEEIVKMLKEAGISTSWMK